MQATHTPVNALNSPPAASTPQFAGPPAALEGAKPSPRTGPSGPDAPSPVRTGPSGDTGTSAERAATSQSVSQLPVQSGNVKVHEWLMSGHISSDADDANGSGSFGASPQAGPHDADPGMAASEPQPLHVDRSGGQAGHSGVAGVLHPSALDIASALRRAPAGAQREDSAGLRELGDIVGMLTANQDKGTGNDGAPGGFAEAPGAGRDMSLLQNIRASMQLNLQLVGGAAEDDLEDSESLTSFAADTDTEVPSASRVLHVGAPESLAQSTHSTQSGPPLQHSSALRKQVQQLLYEQASVTGESHAGDSSLVPSLDIREEYTFEPSITTPLKQLSQNEAKPNSGAPKPSNEADRLQHLCGLNLLGTERESRYDRLTSFVAAVYNVPIVLVSIVDEHRQWFKSVVGLPGAQETDRESSFCAWTLLPQLPEALVVTDARNDPRFRKNVLVTGPPHIQFYGGCPLVSSAGARLGSFCVIDSKTRFFTAEDCNLLCNFAELAVREIEAQRAAERRNFGDGAAPHETLRDTSAWNVGVLVVHIAADSWVVKHANDRAAEVLGLDDVASIIDEQFWSHFTAREQHAGTPSQHYIEQLMEGLDFEVQAKAFTDEGRKVWITCSFRSGTMSQVDDEMPTIAVPMDLDSEPGTKIGYWFVTLKVTDNSAPDSSALGAIVNQAREQLARRSNEVEAGPRATMDWLVGGGGALVFPPDALANLCVSAMCCKTVGAQMYHAQLLPHERTLAQVVEGSDTAYYAKALREQAVRWVALGLTDHVIMDFERVEGGVGAVLAVRRLRMPITTTLRTALHEGLFKVVPNAAELYEGIVQLDMPLALGAARHLAAALHKLHAGGEVHGELTDATVVVGTRAPKHSAAEHWDFGVDLTVRLGTLGLQHDMGAAAATTADALAALRPDYPLFFAPERFDAEGRLAAPIEAPSDVWALGVLLAYLFRFSLPIGVDGPQTLRAKALDGSLGDDVLKLGELSAPPEVLTLIRLCLNADPAKRPSSTRLLAGLQGLCDKHASAA